MSESTQSFVTSVGGEILSGKAEQIGGRVRDAVNVGKFKAYFQVDNSYVLKKLKRILFSFFVKVCVCVCVCVCVLCVNYV